MKDSQFNNNNSWKAQWCENTKMEIVLNEEKKEMVVPCN